MKDFIGSMPEDGSPEYRELVRRQGVLGVSANLPYAAREQLLRDGGVGRTWVADRPTPVKRPRKSMLSNPVPYEPLPSIAASPVNATPPAKSRQLLPPVIVAMQTAMPPAPRPRYSPPFWKFWA